MVVLRIELVEAMVEGGRSVKKKKIQEFLCKTLTL